MTSGGSAVSGPTWKEFMQYALTKYPSPGFQDPIPNPNYNSLKPILRGIWMGNDTVMVDKVTGLRATADTAPGAEIEKVITDVHDILYWVTKSDPTGPVPTNPGSDPQYHLWEPPVEAWWVNNQSRYPSTTSSDLPSGFDTTTTQTTSPLTITGLPDTMKLSDTVNISVTTTGTPLSSVDVLVDNSYVATLPSPFHFVFTPNSYNYQKGSHTITFNATNTSFAKSTTTQTINFTE
jgi:hypothetical protein